MAKIKRSMYMNILLKELYVYKMRIGIWALIVATVFAGMGYRKTHTIVSLNASQQKAIDDYNNNLEEYDTILSEITDTITLTEQQITDLQEYIENSPYMKLDAGQIYEISLQYIFSSETVNPSNALNSYIYYINDGGLASYMENNLKDISSNYWKELITGTVTANNMSIIIMYPNKEEIETVAEYIMNAIEEQTSVVQEKQGDFKLELSAVNYFTRGDVTVVNNQNNYRSNLKNFEINKADLLNKRISMETTKTNYEQDNKPSVMSVLIPSTKKAMLKYGLIGLLFGLLLPCAFILLKFILSDRIRSDKDVAQAGVELLGSHSAKKGYLPELERSIFDIKYMIQQSGQSAVYLLGMVNEECITKQIEDYKVELEKQDISVTFGYETADKAEELKQLTESGVCVLFVETGKTTFSELEACIKLCKKFQVRILGCVVEE